MTMPRFMDIWGQIHGVKVSYEQVSYDDFFEGTPAALKEEIGDSFKFIEEFSISGGDPEVLTPAQVSLILVFIFKGNVLIGNSLTRSSN